MYINNPVSRCKRAVRLDLFRTCGLAAPQMMPDNAPWPLKPLSTPLMLSSLYFPTKYHSVTSMPSSVFLSAGDWFYLLQWSRGGYKDNMYRRCKYANSWVTMHAWIHTHTHNCTLTAPSPSGELRENQRVREGVKERKRGRDGKKRRIVCYKRV